MAFTRNSLILVGQQDMVTDGTTFYKPKQFWRYSTNDAPVTVYAAGYFAKAGSTSGSGELNAYDEIEVLFDRDGTVLSRTMVVSDAAAGTVLFKDAPKVREFGPYVATDVDTTGNIVAAFSMGGPCIIVGFEVETTVAVTTTPVNVAYNLEIGGTNITGGVVTINAAKALGSITAGTAITAANVVGASDTLDLECAATTAFTEGSIKFIIKYQ